MTPIQRQWAEATLPEDRPASVKPRDWAMLLAHIAGRPYQQIAAKEGLSLGHTATRIRCASYRIEAILEWGICPMCQGTGRAPGGAMEA